MSSRDVQDILGITADPSAKARPKKKAKVSHPRPEGISRELLALYGERAPPLPIEDTVKYKAKRALPTVKVSWQKTFFNNQARKDGLLLSHWHQKQEPLVVQPTDSTAMVLDQDSPMLDGENGAQDAPQAKNSIHDTPVEDREYRFAKYNIQVDPPRYDPTLYDAVLKSDSWSKEETEYLLELYNDFYGKWTVIADRYEFKPPSDSKPSGDIHIFQERSMEDMKARFYEVSAKLMAHHTPVSNMTASEFENHEKMMKFDPKQEMDRKRQKEAILNRTKDEKKEEEYLLAELRRIYIRQKKNEEEQAELRERLDHSLTDSKMLQKDKNQKAQRRSIVGEPTAQAATPNSAAVAASASGTAGSTQVTGQKRTSLAPGSTPTRRTVPAKEEKRLGLSTHDRLTAGVSFRSDKLAKARVAKSIVQTQKITAILTELQVPESFQMPTSGVVQAMDKLLGKISLLIEARRAKEKEMNDLKVAKQLKGLKAESEQPVRDKEGERQDGGGKEKQGGNGDVLMEDASQNEGQPGQSQNDDGAADAQAELDDTKVDDKQDDDQDGDDEENNGEGGTQASNDDDDDENEQETAQGDTFTTTNVEEDDDAQSEMESENEEQEEEEVAGQINNPDMEVEDEEGQEESEEDEEVEEEDESAQESQGEGEEETQIDDPENAVNNDEESAEDEVEEVEEEESESEQESISSAEAHDHSGDSGDEAENEETSDDRNAPDELSVANAVPANARIKNAKRSASVLSAASSGRKKRG